MRPVLVLIHGIRTGEEAGAWQERMRLWLAEHRPDLEVITWEYYEGAAPAWNVFVENPRQAHNLLQELMPYAQAGAPISFVAHSNGADIAVRTIEFLAVNRMKTEAAVLIAGAISSDVHRNGLMDLVLAGNLGRAFAYSSPNDEVLALPLIWPYGHLGHTGFTCDGRPFQTQRLINHCFPAFGHCDYWLPENEQSIFARASMDAAPVPNKPTIP